MNSEIKDPVVITAANRTPIGGFLGALQSQSATHLGAVAVADALHILARWDGLGGDGDGGDGDGGDAGDGDTGADNANARLAATVRQTYLPCLGASVTSAVGFGAFAVSELIPLRHFGLASAAAILYAYPLIVGALWGGLWLAPSLRAAPRPRFAWAKLAAAAQQLTAAHAGRVAVAALLATALLGGGLAHLRTETNFLTVFFADDSRVRRSFDLVDAQLGGSGRVEVAMRGGADAFATAAALAQVKRIAARAAAVDTVNHVDSYLLPVAMAHAAFAEPRGGDGGGNSDGDGDGDGDGNSNGDIGDAGAGDDGDSFVGALIHRHPHGLPINPCGRMLRKTMRLAKMTR